MNTLITWRDNLLALQKAGTITPEQKESLKIIKAKIKELKLDAIDI